MLSAKVFCISVFLVWNSTVILL